MIVTYEVLEKRKSYINKLINKRSMKKSSVFVTNNP